MAYQVSRTDTGQFVLTDPHTDTVVIDDDLAAGFEILTARAAQVQATIGEQPRAGGEASASPEPSSRRAGIALAVVLPFVWLAVFYFALANLLAEYTVDRASERATRERVEELEREVQALRSEVAGAPRAAKTRPKVREAKPETETETETETEAEPETE